MTKCLQKVHCYWRILLKTFVLVPTWKAGGPLCWSLVWAVEDHLWYAQVAVLFFATHCLFLSHIHSKPSSSKIYFVLQIYRKKVLCKTLLLVRHQATFNILLSLVQHCSNHCYKLLQHHPCKWGQLHAMQCKECTQIYATNYAVKVPRKLEINKGLKAFYNVKSNAESQKRCRRVVIADRKVFMRPESF